MNFKQIKIKLFKLNKSKFKDLIFIYYLFNLKLNIQINNYLNFQNFNLPSL